MLSMARHGHQGTSLQVCRQHFAFGKHWKLSLEKPLTMVLKMVSILSSCGCLKPVILHARLLFTRTLWAARLLWM